MEKIEISTVAVRIRVIEVGGKKMTISVFGQIQDDYFFDEDVSDEDRIKGYLGWVSHKEKKYVLFYRDGGLFRDEFEYNKVNPSLLYALRRANISQRKNEIDSAMAAINKDQEKCDALNKPYLDLFTNENQIYISI